MKKISLNNKQITDLIRNKEVKIDYISSVEIFDGELIYNFNGKICKIENIDLEIKEPEKTNIFIQNLICEHFNIDRKQVLMVSSTLEDSEFRIRFTPHNEVTIIVCPVTKAISNTKNLSEGTSISVDENTCQIGFYRRLSTSCYFFRFQAD